MLTRRFPRADGTLHTRPRPAGSPPPSGSQPSMVQSRSHPLDRLASDSSWLPALGQKRRYLPHTRCPVVKISDQGLRHGWRKSKLHVTTLRLFRSKVTGYDMLIGYARVSTQDQNADSQIAALTKAGCERIFTDIASGASAKRPELQRVLTDVLRPGDTLVIWKLDRLGRNLQDLIALVARLDQLKAGIRSLTDPIDTTSAQGRVTFQIFAAIAEFERALMLERTMNGLEAARAQGRRGGRPAKPLQRDLGTIRQLIESRSITLDEVAKLEDVSRSTLQRRLRKAPPADATDTAPLKPAKRRRRNPT